MMHTIKNDKIKTDENRTADVGKLEENPKVYPGYMEDRDYSLNKDPRSTPKPPAKEPAQELKNESNKNTQHPLKREIEKTKKAGYPEYFSPSERYEELVAEPNPQDTAHHPKDGPGYSLRQNGADSKSKE